MRRLWLILVAALLLSAPAHAVNVGWGRNVDGTSPNGLADSCGFGDTKCHFAKGDAGALDLPINDAGACEVVTYETAASSTIVGNVESCPLGTPASCFAIFAIPDGASVITTSKHAFLRSSIASGVGTITRSCTKALSIGTGDQLHFTSDGDPSGTRCWSAHIGTLTTCSTPSLGISRGQGYQVARPQEILGWSCYFEVVAGGVGVGDSVNVGPEWLIWNVPFHSTLSCNDVIDLDQVVPFVHNHTCPTPVPVGTGSLTQLQGATVVKFRGVFTEPNNITDLESVCVVNFR